MHIMFFWKLKKDIFDLELLNLFFSVKHQQNYLLNTQ